jgi:hypothetical protein
LKALMFAKLQDPLGIVVLIDPHAAQSVAGHAALSISELYEPALASKYFCREFAAVFAGHSAFDTFDDGRDRTAVIVELFGAVMYRDPATFAYILVVGALVGVLKTTPSADVIDQYDREIGLTPLDVVD